MTDLNKRKLVQTMAAVGALGPFAMGTSSAQAHKGDIVIGASQPITGIFSFAGVAMNNALIGRQFQAMPSQALKHRNLQGPHGGFEWIRPQAARDAEVVLGGANRYPGKRIHDVAIGVVARTDVKDHVAGDGIPGVPKAFHPGWVAGVDVIESSWS